MSSSSDRPANVDVRISNELSSAFEKTRKTTQLDQRNIATSVGGAIEPPYDPSALAAFTETNETHSACIEKKSRWEVGFGFDLVPTVDDPSEAEKKTLEDFWFSSDSEWKTGPERTPSSTPTKVLKTGRKDFREVGWECLEVIRANDGSPKGLAQVPATEVRHRRVEETDSETGETLVSRGRGYVQVKGRQKRYYGEAGDIKERNIAVDSESGDVGSVENTDNVANELIFIPNESNIEPYYGIPNWISAVQTMAGDQAAKEYNRDFFEHNRIPYYAIKVTGGKLTDQSRRDLEKLFQGFDSNGNHHRVAILEAEKFATTEAEYDYLDEDADGIEIELEPVGAETNDDDMSFQDFRMHNEHEIAKVHEVPELLINRAENSNRSNAREWVADFANNVIAPEQVEHAKQLYEIIHKTLLECPDWTLEFELRGARNREREVDIASKKISASQGWITVGEVREELGLDPFGDERDNELIGDAASSDSVDEAIEQTVENQFEELVSEQDAEPAG